MPTELVLLGVIASIFLVIFFFLYIELSTRKKRLVQDIKIMLRDLPSKLSEQKVVRKQSKLDAISEFLKWKSEGEYLSRKLIDEMSRKLIDEIYALYSDNRGEADSLIEEATILTIKLSLLDALSIGELEKIHSMIEKYYNKLSKSDVDIIPALSRVNSMLDHFIPMYFPKRTANV